MLTKLSKFKIFFFLNKSFMSKNSISCKLGQLVCGWAHRQTYNKVLNGVKRAIINHRPKGNGDATYIS